MALNLAKAVIGYLKERPEEKFTARQVAEWVFATYPDECQEKRANSRGDYIKSDADLVQQLVAEISSQRPRMQTKHPELKTTEGRPRKYYYSERSDSAEVAAVESEGTSAATDILYYKEDVSRKFPIGEIDGLISGFEHNRDHYSKMVASLIPILTMLTSPPLNDLLSPEYDDNDKRPITNIAKVIQNKQVLYVGLDSLPDSKVGSAIGSILMADGTAVAGDRYNYGGNDQDVQFYVDEAAEVINDPTIQMLNKGRGAGFRLTVATQTLADFTTRLGSQSKARQVLGNINNILSLRVTDNETQKYITEGLPTVKVRSMQSTYRHEVESGGQKQYEAGYSEAEKEEDVDLFQPAMLGKLPDLHYIGKLTGGRVIKGKIPIMVPQ